MPAPSPPLAAGMFVWLMASLQTDPSLGQQDLASVQEGCCTLSTPPALTSPCRTQRMLGTQCEVHTRLPQPPGVEQQLESAGKLRGETVFSPPQSVGPHILLAFRHFRMAPTHPVPSPCHSGHREAKVQPSPWLPCFPETPVGTWGGGGVQVGLGRVGTSSSRPWQQTGSWGTSL